MDGDIPLSGYIIYGLSLLYTHYIVAHVIGFCNTRVDYFMRPLFKKNYKPSYN